MLSQATICAAVQKIARVRHECDDTAILARAILQLLWEVERMGIDDRTLAGELRRTRAAVRKLRNKPTRARNTSRRQAAVLRLAAK